MATEAPAGMDAIDQLRIRCHALEESNAQLERINEALMDRVERDMDMQGNSFSLFQAAIALEDKVRERTAALTQALHAIEQTNQDLQASNKAAFAAARTKSAFLASMSHELRTPMNGVVGMTEVLLTTALDQKQRTAAQTIRQSALSLLKILNEVLDFSKIEAGRMETESTPFDLRAKADQALEMVKTQIESKGLALRIDWADDLPAEVIGDPTRYMQIIINLMGNAVKFTEKGHIHLRARVESAQQQSLVVRFEIEDSGIGIKREMISKLFESFSQADSSTTRQYGGTGLGLAIVRRLCNMMGGDCGVTSEYGVGSCFWFTLTLQRSAPAEDFAAGDAATVATPSSVWIERKLHALVIEDDLVNQMVARGMLEALGCECATIENGEDALACLVAPHAYDIVMMDCHMPLMDGWEVTRRVRAHEAASGGHATIVALTANAMAGDKELCLEAGMDDFLSKPFQMQELIAVLDKWCPHQGAGG